MAADGARKRVYMCGMCRDPETACSRARGRGSAMLANVGGFGERLPNGEGSPKLLV